MIGADMIKKYLELSTGNISEELSDYLYTADWGMGLDVTEIPDFKYVIRGWERDELSANGAPQELLNIIDYADENGCELISIDEEAEDDPNFPVTE